MHYDIFRSTTRLQTVLCDIYIEQEKTEGGLWQRVADYNGLGRRRERCTHICGRYARTRSDFREAGEGEGEEGQFANSSFGLLMILTMIEESVRN